MNWSAGINQVNHNNQINQSSDRRMLDWFVLNYSP